MLARKRTLHSKSRRGCLPCKQRHRKCDESRPTCAACQERNIECTWLQSGPNSIHVREFRVYTPQKLAPVVDLAEVQNIEHFCSCTLGFLQDARPSVLWKHSVGFLLHTSPAFRKIIAAFGSQQHLLTHQDPEDPHLAMHQKRADSSYSQALRSLRQSIAARTASDQAPLVFGAILMILLESIRDSPSELLVHLGCGIDIVSETRMQSRSTDECDDMLTLLHGFYASCMVYCSAPGRSTQMPGFLSEHQFRMKSPATLNSLSALSHEMSVIHVESINATNKMHRPGDYAAKRAELIATFTRIRQRHERLREALDKWHKPGQEHHPSFYISKAGVLLGELTIDSILSDDFPNKEEERLCFTRVLDLLENSLLELNAMGHGPRSFSIVLGPLSILDVVTTVSGDASIRQRCLQILELCPRREVLWQAAQMKTVLAQKLEAVHQSEESSRPGSRSSLQASLAEDTTSTAQSLPAAAKNHFLNYEAWGQI